MSYRQKTAPGTDDTEGRSQWFKGEANPALATFFLSFPFSPPLTFSITLDWDTTIKIPSRTIRR